MIQTGDTPVVEMPEVTDASTFWDSIKGMGFDEFISTVTNSLISFGLRLMLAILVFYAGRFLISRIFKTVFGVMTRRKVDASLTTFVLSLVRISLYFFLIIIVIGILGVETSSFIAIFASAGMAIGMALSGTLQNFAAWSAYSAPQALQGRRFYRGARFHGYSQVHTALQYGNQYC